jgi:hypothetical protein
VKFALVAFIAGACGAQPAPATPRHAEIDRAIADLTAEVDTARRTHDSGRELIAQSRLGVLKWQRSCPHPWEDGSCVELQAEKRTQPACDPVEHTRVIVLRRDPVLVQEATAHLTAAVALANRAPPARAEERVALAAARFHLAEPRYEAALKVAATVNLTGGSPRRQERLVAYVTEMRQALEGAKRAFTEVSAGPPTVWRAAAGGRIGQLYLQFATRMRSAPVPPELGPDLVDAFCESLFETTETLVDEAGRAFEFCRDSARNLGVSTEWLGLCNDALRAMGR